MSNEIMNDDFLHRLRAEPLTRFLAALKAKLDAQGAAPPASRRVSLRTLAIAIVLGGAGVAIALVVSGEIASWTSRMEVVTNAPVPTPAPNNTSSPAADTPTAPPEQKAQALAASPPTGIEWVLVPKGPFIMGATEEEKAEFFKFSGPNFRKRLVDGAGPPHEVRLDAFFILRNLVTNQQYSEFTAATGRMHPDAGSRFQGPNQPVVIVTWDDARAFCAWIGARLPSEAEWEKAARGTQGLAYPWGNTWDSAKLQSMDGIAHQSFANQADYLSWKQKNIENDPAARTADVGSFPEGASPYGALDMAGNAWDTPRTVNVTWIRENFMAPNTGRRVTSFRCAKNAS